MPSYFWSPNYSVMKFSASQQVNPEEDEFEGPLKHRSCTDVICFIFFAAFIVGMVSLFSFKTNFQMFGKVTDTNL